LLGADYDLVAPEHYGCDRVGPWTGEHAFTLADEAARTIALIDGADRKVHLVGHSYGGGVALHAALIRPDSVASLVLYEPSAFHFLQREGPCLPRPPSARPGRHEQVQPRQCGQSPEVKRREMT
jgi:pimeloyl-ACP methyl ester carboxylesterase